MLIESSPSATSAAVEEEPVFDGEMQKTEEGLIEAASEVATAKEQRRSSHTWKGFKFKKQLSKVDLKIKNTFSHPTEKGAKKNASSVFHTNPQESDAAGERRPDDERGAECGDEGVAVAVPRIREPSSAAVASSASPSQTLSTRPTDLNLFTGSTADEEKPARPERRKDRKRFSLERQTPRDSRLLSVPNIKYQNVLKDTKKSKPSNNQAFFSLIRRLSKFLGFLLQLIVNLRNSGS